MVVYLGNLFQASHPRRTHHCWVDHENPSIFVLPGSHLCKWDMFLENCVKICFLLGKMWRWNEVPTIRGGIWPHNAQPVYMENLSAQQLPVNPNPPWDHWPFEETGLFPRKFNSKSPQGKAVCGTWVVYPEVLLMVQKFGSCRSI